ncbi:unnamed protein product [Symbiodinium sp. CCMP2592]|nr:unnamed protein product [Symbiodinium sp. CCMP2592]
MATHTLVGTPTDSAAVPSQDAASMPYNLLHDVPFGIYQSRQRAQWMDARGTYNSLDDVPHCLQNRCTTTSFQARMASSSGSRGTPAQLLVLVPATSDSLDDVPHCLRDRGNEPISCITMDMLHTWADQPASQLLTPHHLAQFLHQWGFSAVDIVEWGIYYYFEQAPCTDAEWKQALLQQLHRNVYQLSMSGAICYFKQLLVGAHREDFFEELYTVACRRIQLDDPTTTMTTIALPGPSPAPLRSLTFPDGLPHLSGLNLVRVNRANQLYHFTTTICAEAHHRNLIIAVENPRSSLYWSTSFWAAAASFCPMHTDFQHCAFGGRRPKWTRLCHNHQAFHALHRVCPGGACAAQHLPWGRSEDGSFATAGESAYPPQLATAIAQCFARAVTFLPEAEPSLAAMRATSGLQPKASAVPPLVPEHKAVLVMTGPSDATSLPTLRARLPEPWSDSRFAPAGPVPAHSQLLRADKKGSDRLELAWGISWSPEEFIHKAVQAGHPKKFDSLLPSALSHSIDVNAKTTPADRVGLRAEWFAKWTKRAAELSGDEKKLKSSLPEYARKIVLPKRILLWREILEDLKYPDIGVLDEMLEGVHLTGQTPCTGVFPGAFKPAKRTSEQLRSKASESRQKIIDAIKSQGHLDEALEQKVDEEVELGWLSEPIDPADLPEDATISRRFAIEQSGKIRLIDDLSDSGVNGSVQTTESPKPQSLDVVAAMALACLRQLPGTPMLGKTFDLKSAYRQMFVSPDDLKEAYIAYFSHRERKVIVRQMLALPFGATRAVFSYLRVAHSMWYIGCWALKLIWSHFFDDFLSLATQIEAKAVDLAISSLFRLLGWKVSEDKDKPFAESFAALGVRVSFERFLQGEVLFHNTDKRILEVSATLRHAADDPALTQKDLSRIRGRMVFAGGQLFGRAGRLCVAALAGEGCSTKANLSNDAKQAMLQFADLLEANWPRVLRDVSADPVYIFTDASYSEVSGGTFCGIGGVCFDHKGHPLGFFSEELSCFQKRLLGEGRSKTIIFEAELATIVIAYVFWKDWLRGKPAVIFVDNNSARDVSISGTSRNDVGKSLASLLLTVESLAKTFSWFARVPSPADIADTPSREVLKSFTVSGRPVPHFPCEEAMFVPPGDDVPPSVAAGLRLNASWHQGTPCHRW